MTSLPTLRRKIFKAFTGIVLLYGGFGFFLVISVFLASKTTPKVIHMNYDSIAAADHMKEAWQALDQPNRYPEHPAPYWTEQFEKSLTFEEANITEPGEKETAHGIRKLWDQYKKEKSISLNQFTQMNQLLKNLAAVNEKGMFELATENTNLSRKVLIGAILYFLITLVLAIIVADNLATRLSRPLKNIAESLQRRPGIGRRLKLIEPTSLEVFILSNELKRLWDRVVEAEKVNVMEVMKQKNQLETVLESVEDALLVVDLNGQVSHCNSYLLTLIGLTESDVKGHFWGDLPTNHENYLKLRSLVREDMPDALEIELHQKNIPRQFSARSRKISGASGTPISTLFLLHDITEKKQRDRFRSEFIDLLSHEIKTPLQSLGTASEFLCSHKETLSESMIPFVETIAEDVERIRAVAHEFVQVTQSHSKMMKLRMEHVALNQVLPEWIKPFMILAKDRDVKLHFIQEGSQVIWAQIDTVKFPWVISNILSNAIRFSPQEGEVSICLTDRNGFVEIQVKDQGPGISEEDQKRMFEPFYQSTTTQAPGRRGLFGIGLTIAKEVVEAHEGRIEYYLQSPHGSEFRILLPFPTQNYS